MPSLPAASMEVEIHDIAFGGKGVGRADGLVIFVPGVVIGERVEVEIIRRKKQYAQAQLKRVLTPSPDRVAPECPVFERCGGCAYQQIAYPRQLEIKQTQVHQILRRLGRLPEPVPVGPTVPSPHPYGYRNRIRVHAAGGVIGFYARDAQSLLDIAHCPIAEPEVNARLAQLRRHPVPDGDHSVALRDTRFFEQTNDLVAEALLAEVARVITPGGRLIDAYSGAGFFSRHLRDKFERVIGIEENRQAVARARSQAQPHEEHLAGDVAAHLAALLADPQPTSVILDPPAAGVAPPVIESLLAAQPREILYISCDPATLARDLSRLCPTYSLVKATPFDMFPQTAEIEVLAHLKPTSA